MRDDKNGVTIDFRVLLSNNLSGAYIADYGSENHARFVTWLTDRAFSICVGFNKKFQDKGCRSVAVKIDFDGGLASTEKIQKVVPGRVPERLTFDHLMHRAKHTKSKYKFSFGKLYHDQSISTTREQEDDQIANRGKIVVTIQRGTAAYVPESQCPDTIHGDLTMDLRTTPAVLEQKSYGTN
jgi:hypothetical protein